MNDLEYIKQFSKITIKKVCDEENINISNLYNGRISENKLKKVKKRIEHEIAKLYVIKECDKNDKQ